MMHRMSQAGSDDLAGKHLSEDFGVVLVFVDNAPATLMQLEGRRCATSAFCFGCCLGQ